MTEIVSYIFLFDPSFQKMNFSILMFRFFDKNQQLISNKNSITKAEDNLNLFEIKVKFNNLNVYYAN